MRVFIQPQHYLTYGRNWLKAVHKIDQCRSRVVDPRGGENTRG